MSALDKFFKLKEHGSRVRVEAMSGLTTFLAMAYITIVNPSILSETGMDFGAVFVATCIAATFGTIVMGLYANYPIALAPGIGRTPFLHSALCSAWGTAGRQRLARCLFRV